MATEDEEKRTFSKSEPFATLKARAKYKAILLDFEFVLGFVHDQLHDEKAAYETLKSQNAPELEFRHLWKFYLPGTVVIKMTRVITRLCASCMLREVNQF